METLKIDGLKYQNHRDKCRLCMQPFEKFSKRIQISENIQKMVFSISAIEVRKRPIK